MVLITTGAMGFEDVGDEVGETTTGAMRRSEGVIRTGIESTVGWKHRLERMGSSLYGMNEWTEFRPVLVN